jgi:hypothetical protein
VKHRGNKLSAAKFAEPETEEAKNMSMQLPREATLGDLIAAVTDEVTPITSGSVNTNLLVSFIVRDLIATQRVRLNPRTIEEMA